MPYYFPNPNLGDAASPQVLAQATLAAPTVDRGRDDEAEQRHARHDDRERDRAQSREHWRLLDPLAWWPKYAKEELEREASRGNASSFTANRTKLPMVSVDPFGTRRPNAGPRADPFGVFDGLGRLRRDHVSTTGLSTGDGASSYKRMLCANAMGLTLSTHVVITWPMVGIHSDQSVHDGLRKVFSVLRDMNRRNVVKGRPALAWLWTLERSEARGLHTHLLFSCPPDQRGLLLRAIARAVRTYTNRSATEVTVTQIPAQTHAADGQAKSDYVIAMTFPREKRDGSLSQPREMRAQWALWRYIFKGVEHSYWDGKHWKFRFLARSPQGKIQGQRWGYSTASLGDAAWDRYVRSVGGDPACVTRFIDSVPTLEYPTGIDVYSPVWSA